MAIDIIGLLQDYNIDFATSGKNISKDFIGVNCPDCTSDTDYHLGISMDGKFASCWRCQHKSIPYLVTVWLGVSFKEAYKVLEEYEGVGHTYYQQSPEAVVRPTEIELPGSELLKPHRTYLEKRDFDPDFLVEKYGLRGTGPSCFYEEQDFSLSIIIPVLDRRGRLMSFQARSISSKAEIRYRGLKEEKAINHHKNTLYNLNNITGDTVVLVEGVVDVWRGGDNFLCTFGTSLKPSQMRELSGLKKVFILFDDEEAAQAKAMQYGRDLCCTGIEVENVCLELDGRDVGDLTSSEALDLRKELGIK